MHVIDISLPCTTIRQKTVFTGAYPLDKVQEDGDSYFYADNLGTYGNNVPRDKRQCSQRY